MSETYSRKPVPGYPLYMADTDGKLWTCNVPFGRPKDFVPQDSDWRIMKTRKGKLGYFYINGYTEGKKSTLKVHRLVLLTFVGPCPDGMECRHLNGDQSDNRLSNLAWGTKLENHNDRRLHGTIPFGEKAGPSRLTEEQVIAIRKMASEGMFFRQIAKIIGTTDTNVRFIVRGKTWRHLNSSTPLTMASPKSRGSRQHNSKLNDDKVREIRRLAPTTSLRELSKSFGVSIGVVSSIISRKSWKHVD